MHAQKQFVVVSPVDHGGLGDFGFTYATDMPLETGQLVRVPLRQQYSLGVVMGPTGQPAFATKPVTEAFDITLPPHTVELAPWMAEYYAASAKAVWQTILPSGLTKRRRPSKSEGKGFNLPKRTHELTSEQTAALDAIRTSRPQPMLVHGITGSGKTEIYLQLATETLESDRSVIVLVPEITLTPQIVAIFTATFGDIVIATHSGMTEAERHKAWQTALSSTKPRIVIGPRSSLFLPLSHIGLIVIDECHETSYKQDQAPRYQADVVAGKLAKLSGAQLILGSATPTLSQFYLAEHDRLGLVSMRKRANQQPLPTTTIIDLRDRTQHSKSRFISQMLLDALSKTLLEERQSLLFINRRGSASSQICGDCGTVNLCPNCQLPLTFHADKLQLVCHYCNYHRAPGATCLNCQSSNLRYLGGGTKRIEAEIAQLLPTARLARLDRDSATRQYLESVYRGLYDHSIDILIGTQIVAKGLDLPSLDLVGIVSADTMLHLPDFTASERTFNLITQVSGRAGRGDRAGQVIIQSYTPDHPAILAAATYNYPRFAQSELAERQLLAYPPYVFLLKLTYVSSSSAQAQSQATSYAQQLAKINGLLVLGPAPAFIERVAGSFHWHLIIKSKQRTSLVDIARELPNGWTADLDPASLL